MAADQSDRLAPSILDRLLDPGSAGTAHRPGYSVRQMMEAVKNDLHHLLNTRQTLSDEALRFERTRRAMGYGMPDLVSLNVITPQRREEIAQMLEATIRQYEPRLRNIEIRTLDPNENEPLKVRFRVTARLAVDAAPEVAVDTTLQLSTGHFIPESAS